MGNLKINKAIMTSNEIRDSFLRFFEKKAHHIVPSAPMVIKNDPTLMFTNAGMNQFKDIFLANTQIVHKRIANSQKCLRVSGKHNDLEEVGHDTYHHTMFEMLGNWSFGDYFKQDAISWAWDYLTNILKIDSTRLYATVFEGSAEDKVEMDIEAFNLWKQFLPEDRILLGNKKDNFWEMGDTGPCGPCSEIHIDLRSTDEISVKPGRELVNEGDPQVIEIWNLVFIQYNRKADNSLETLPSKHVDTGMGFERLCRVVQNKTSNYDTDIFQPIIREISTITGINYGKNDDADIAMRVISDHLRAIAFSIADGQLPSNNKAGYVIRRILRRAVRYGFTFLDQKAPFIYSLVDTLGEVMGESYPELVSQKELIKNVIREEESTFLRTLETGIKMLNGFMDDAQHRGVTEISATQAFILYDTYGFPPDLTRLILRERKMNFDQSGFGREMEEQKNRSKSDAIKDTSDWHIVKSLNETVFHGYESLEAEVEIGKYRRVTQKGKELWQVVFDCTPFYAEGGGQVGDTGYLENKDEKIRVINTVKENNLIIHLMNSLPGDVHAKFKAVVDGGKRINIANNHTSTHLLHYALRTVLGKHVEQKGSLVSSDYFRFDFSHFQKLSDEELRSVEVLVNNLIRQNIHLEEKRNIPMLEASSMGAMALFGEKYGDSVRVIKFGDSIELCGGTHVRSTGQIGFFLITKESAIAAGIRRIEAISGEKCAEHIFSMDKTIKKITEIIPLKLEPLAAIEKLLEEQAELNKQIEIYRKEKINSLVKKLKNQVISSGDINYIITRENSVQPEDIKDLSYRLRAELKDIVLVIANEHGGKANLTVMISDDLVKMKNLNAVEIIKEISKEIQGGGGGQAFYATAGGKNPSGIPNALKKAEEILSVL
jgi:alanyl-tRNA synthetase